MTEDSDTDFHVPKGKMNQLKYSITNLWDEFGRADSPLIGFLVNGLMIALGIGVYVALSGLAAYVGAVFAILNGLAILKWVLKL